MEPMNSMRAAFAEHPTATKLAVLLVALLLFVMAAVLAVGLVGDRNGVADASPSVPPASDAPPSEAASVEPSPSQPASPSVAPGPELALGDVFAVTAVEDVALREGPGGGGEQATLEAGEVALVVDLPNEVDGATWYAVQNDERFGWVADDGTVTLHRRLVQQRPTQVTGLVGGPTGFIAWGISPHRSDEAMEAFTAVSSNGVDWSLASAPDGEIGALFASVAAGGPDGWLLLRGTAEGTGFGGAWRSPDGSAWEQITPTRSDGGDLTAVVPVGLLGHASGYALVVRDDATGTSRHRVLTSVDGVAWREHEVPIDSTDLRLGRLGDGFLAWAPVADGSLFMRFSPDGEQWLDPTDGNTSPGPAGSSPMLAEAGRVLVARTTEVETGSARWWTAPIRPETDAGWPTLTWTEQTAVADEFADIGVTALVSDGGAVVALGRRFDDGTIVARRSTDGSSWDDLDAGELRAANASVERAAGSDAGIAVVGYETTDAGPNPRIMHASAGDAWTVQAGADFGTVGSALPGDCPEAPTTMLEWMAISGVIGAACFGDESLTFTAWHTEAGGCGGYSPGIYEPEWLASPFAFGGIVLLPLEAPTGGCGDGALAPELGDVPEPQQWVEVTGHWADPAAAECRFRPDPRAVTGPAHPDLPFHCRTVFVFTDVVPAGVAP